MKQTDKGDQVPGNLPDPSGYYRWPDTDSVADDTASLPHRAERDRRTWAPMPRLPFKDSNGMLVTHDRRRIPERRLSGIKVEWFL